MASFAIGLEGASFTTAYSFPTTTPEYPGPLIAPGTVAIATDGAVWMFVKVANSQTIAAGDAVYVSSTDTTFVVTSLANAAKALKGMLVGVAGAAVTSAATSVSYMWIQRAGYAATVNVATSSTANADLHTSATSGRLTSTGSAGNSATVTGIVGLATAASNTAACILNFPAIGVAD